MGISRRVLLDLRRRYLKSKLPSVEGTVKAPVNGPVQVRRDRWGVTHIKANCLADCYVGLGYAMAQDRLWHLDYWRRLAHGRVAEVLGPRYLRSDRLHRAVGLTQAAEEASGEVMLVLASLAEGIKAWMQEGARSLPVEFDLLEYEPEPWTPVDSIATWKWRWWMLTGRLGMIATGEVAPAARPVRAVCGGGSGRGDDLVGRRGGVRYGGGEQQLGCGREPEYDREAGSGGGPPQ